MVKSKLRKKNKRKKIQITLIVMFFLCVLAFSIAYASLSGSLRTNTSGGISIPFEGVGVTGVELSSKFFCGYNILTEVYSDDSITVNVNLPEPNCRVIYDVTLENKTDSHMQIAEIISNYNNNPNIIFEFIGIKENDILLNGSKINATLIIQYAPEVVNLPENTEYSSIIEFSFEPYESIEPIAVISYSEINWTNQDVLVCIQFNQNDVTLANNNGSNEYLFTDNEEFTFDYLNHLGVSTSKTVSVTWIDKIPPLAFDFILSNITDNSITVSGFTTDSGGSGVAGYYYSLDNGSIWVGPFGPTYTFHNLVSDTVYLIKMKAIDHAGNETVTETKWE